MFGTSLRPMKRWLLTLGLFIGSAFGQTITPNLQMTEPVHGAPNWDTQMNANFNILDKTVGAVCHTNIQQGADLGARIIACDTKLGGFNHPLQQGNLAYNTTPTPGVIRVDVGEAATGPISTFPVFISAGHVLSLAPGVYTNALASAQPPFQLANNTSLECDNFSAIIQNSSNIANGDPRVVATASAYQVIGSVGQNNVPYATASGVVVKGCHFQDSGLGKLTTLTATVVLTNCKNCKVLNNWFDGIGVTGVGLIGGFYSGTNCSTFSNWLAQYCGNFGDGDEIAGNVFNGTQEAISVINNQNVDIHDNKMSQHATGAAAYIDLESNTPKDYMQNIDVHDNIFDCATPQINTGCFGITMQSVGPNDGHLKLHNNIFFGPAPGTALSGQTTGGISSGDFNPHGTHEVEIYNNKISNTSNPAISTAGVDYAYVHDNQAICTGGGIAILDYTQHSVFKDNRFYNPLQTLYTITSVATTADQATTVYTGTFADGGSGALASQTVNITGFTNPLNNGSFGVSTSTTTTLTVYNPAGVSETHAATGLIGCSFLLRTDQNNTEINESNATADYNIFEGNVGVGMYLLQGTHDQIIDSQASGRNAEGNGKTFQVPTGFANAIPGGITTAPLTAPILNLLGPTTNACSVVFTNATYFWIVTAVASNGQEAPSNEVTALAGGGSGCGKLGWTYVPGAASYNIYRGTITGGELLMFNVPQSTLGYTDGGGQTPGVAVPTTNTTGGIQDGALTINLPICADDSKNLSTACTTPFANLFASPPPLGGTVPNSGKFNSITLATLGSYAQQMNGGLSGYVNFTVPAIISSYNLELPNAGGNGVLRMDFDATNGKYKLSTVPDPGVTPALVTVINCGSAVACADAFQHSPIVAYGSVPLTSASPSTASVTTLTFSSSTSYRCTATPEGTTAAIAAGGVAINRTSGTAMTLTGPNTVSTVVDFICWGN